MEFKLSSEQIQENWEILNGIIDTYISEPRKTKLLELYSELEDIMVTAPAASSLSNHNCFPGGYVDHVIRVVTASSKVYGLWVEMGMKEDIFTVEELIFAAINHDLGKVGFPGKPNTIVNDNAWEVEKMGKEYKINPVNPYSTVPDRSLFILQSYGIPLTYNEWLGIKLHDGLYDESNKSYMVSFMPDSRLRNSLPLILHQADLLASRIEWESQWLDKVGGKVPSPFLKKEKKAKPAKEYSPSLMKALKEI